MIILKKQNEVSLELKDRRNLALIPTMGNLHDGHLELIKQAKNFAETIIVSIFVNPVQFNSLDDLKNYPRTLEKDIDVLTKLDIDILFTPSKKEMYPIKPTLSYSLPALSNELCGSSRPGHFEGVIIIIEKLFDLFKPDHVFFGKKDYQQLMLIKQFISDSKYNMTCHGIETVREKDLLALSSRNNLLSSKDKMMASTLYKILLEAIDQIKQISEIKQVEDTAVKKLTNLGWVVDYIEIRRQKDLLKPKMSDTKLVILGAAYYKSVRLIDNIEFCTDGGK